MPVCNTYRRSVGAEGAGVGVGMLSEWNHRYHPRRVKSLVLKEQPYLWN